VPPVRGNEKHPNESGGEKTLKNIESKFRIDHFIMYKKLN
jgi:hypothetical protein